MVVGVGIEDKLTCKLIALISKDQTREKPIRLAQEQHSIFCN